MGPANLLNMIVSRKKVNDEESDKQGKSYVDYFSFFLQSIILCALKKVKQVSENPTVYILVIF